MDLGTPINKFVEEFVLVSVIDSVYVSLCPSITMELWRLVKNSGQNQLIAAVSNPLYFATYILIKKYLRITF